MSEQRAEQPASMLAKYASGVSPMDALQCAPGISRPVMAHTIYNALKSGALAAIAGRGIEQGGAKRMEAMGVPVQAAYWQHARHVNADYAAFWTTGHLTIEISTHYSDRVLNFYNVRFDRDGLAELFPRPAAAPERERAQAAEAPPGKVKNPGGRPRKEFWDDLLIEMFRRLWEDKWTPTKHAEIENAMLDWAAKNGHELGPTSVKIPAAKLLKIAKG